MKIVNRGYIIVRPKEQFWSWANQYSEEEFKVEAGDEIEPNLYLITEDFFEVEPLIEQNFKNIFKTELMMVTEDEANWPEDRSMDRFAEWFEIEIGSTVMDMEKADLKRDEVS